MQLSTIAVGSLSTSSLYVDAFVVQICSDAAYTNLIQTLTSSVVWDGEAWNQVDPIFFDGLTLGQTYYLRCAVRAPVSGVLSVWKNWTVVAGATVIPACTFGGSFTGTLSGVTYMVAPGNVPEDIDHFSAWWSFDGSAPPAGAPAMKGNIPPTFTFNVFAAGVPGQSITMFVRGVNTAQQVQPWVALGGAIKVMQTVDANGKISATAIIAGKNKILGDISDLANGTIGINSLVNPHFSQVANQGSQDTVFLGWTSSDQSFVLVTQDFGQEFSGVPTLKLSTKPRAILPVGATDHFYHSSDPIVVTPSTKYYVQAEVKTGEDFTLPSGVTAITEFGVQVTYADGTTSTSYLPALGRDLAWQSITGQIVIPASNGGNSLPSTVVFTFHTRLLNTNASSVTLPNGSIWTAWFDHVVFDKVLALTDEQISKNGSIPISYAQSMTYTCTDTSIMWNWSINIYRTDNGLTITSTTGSVFISGLNQSTTYFFYPYYDESAEYVDFVAQGMGAPAIAHLAPGITLTQTQARCDHVPLSLAPVTAATIATPAATPNPTTSGAFQYSLKLNSDGTYAINAILVNPPLNNYEPNVDYTFVFTAASGDTAAYGTTSTDSNGTISFMNVDYSGKFAPNPSNSPSGYPVFQYTGTANKRGNGGSGGGSGVCLHPNMLVLTKSRGIVGCSTIVSGEYIKGPKGWLEVVFIKTSPCDLWVRITTSCDQVLTVTPGHGFTLIEAETVPACELALNSLIPTVEGATHPVSIALYKEASFSVMVSLRGDASEDVWDHVFYIGDTVPTVATHNSNQLGC